MFFVKQKTADEMRISDWSSDVCSSDLAQERRRRAILGQHGLRGSTSSDVVRCFDLARPGRASAPQCPAANAPDAIARWRADGARWNTSRSEERRAGQVCVSTCGSRMARYD